MKRASAVAFVLVAACSRGESGTGSVSAPASASVSAAVSAPADASPSPSSWAGTYSSHAGPFYVPDGGEWSGVKFRGDDAGVGLGDGAISIVVDPGGRAHGTIEGALGALRVDGEMRDGRLAAGITPQDPATGFSGSLLGKLENGAIAGTMHLSTPTGNVIREATFTLAKH